MEILMEEDMEVVMEVVITSHLLHNRTSIFLVSIYRNLFHFELIFISLKIKSAIHKGGGSLSDENCPVSKMVFLHYPY